MNQDGTVIVGGAGEDGASASHAWMLDLHGDSDGDGLQDDWEINGIPYVAADGSVQRYLLPDASPAHKELYFEIDSMQGMDIGADAIAAVQQAFEAAPLPNPDGTNGVNIHFVQDETDIPLVIAWPTDGCWPLDFDDYRNARYGTPQERADPRGPNLLLAKAKAYRYCIVADMSDPALGGCGQHPGDNIVVYRGSIGNRQSGREAVLMHEIGHNLGLGHGGGDDINGKPNYPSIMNYVLSYRFIWTVYFWRLDFSRLGPPQMPDLNENSLDETAGVGTPGSLYAAYSMPYGVNVVQGGNLTRAVRYASLNGAPTDFGDTAGGGMQDRVFSPGVAQDLNYLPRPPVGIVLPTAPSPGQVLTAYDDWAHVVLPTLAARGPGAPAPAIPTDELTIAAADWIEQNFPPPPGACYANCDGSTIAPVVNVQDFACFLNRFAAGDTCANCDGSTSPPVLNVLDFSCFLNRFAAGCS